MKPKKIIEYSDVDMSIFIEEHLRFKSDIEAFFISAAIFSGVNINVINIISNTAKEDNIIFFEKTKPIDLDILKFAILNTYAFDLDSCIVIYEYIIKLNKILNNLKNEFGILGEVGLHIAEQNKILVKILSTSFLKIMTGFENINESKNVLNNNITRLSLNENLSNVLNTVFDETDNIIKGMLKIALDHVNNKPIVEDKIALIDVDPKQTEIIIALNELGILGFLRDKHPHLISSANRLANVIHLITGKPANSLVSNINAMVSKTQIHTKNNPYSSDNVVKKVKDRLDEQLNLI